VAGKDGQLPSRKLLAAARWLAKHCSAENKQAYIIQASLLDTAAGRWQAIAQELEEVGAAGK
jgi:hypothetical protein